MAFAALRTAVLLGLLSPAAAHAVGIGSPAQLGPADYWLFAEGSNGAFARVETHRATPFGVTLPDPTIGGIPLTGHVILETALNANGPATVANVVLSHPGPAPLSTRFEVGAFVTFDLAVLSATLLTAQVRVQGSGIGGAAGGAISPGNSFSNSDGFITVYTTDANGQISTPTQNFWQVRDDFTTTPIDATFTLDTNTLYKVIVRSTASIEFNADTDFSQYAYMYMDPLFSSVTEGAEVFVSPNAVVPEPSSALLLAPSLAALSAFARRRRAG